MKAVVLSNGKLNVQEVSMPVSPAPGHLIVKIEASAINSGDKFFLKFPAPPGTVKSLYDIRGVSGAGEVLAIGEGVPEAYLGRHVTIYRQLAYSEHVIGCWSEFAQVHYLDCAILPDNCDPKDYAGSMVNIITPYAFLKQITGEGHKAILITAGNSATGIALLGFCLAFEFPVISLVRTEKGRQELMLLGAKNVLVQSDPDFDRQLTDVAMKLAATAVFDGVGGQILNRLLPLIPTGSTIFSYGFIGDNVPFSFHTSMLAIKNIAIRPFANTSSETVKNPDRLALALMEIGKLIDQPYFKTKSGKIFRLEEINDALAFVGTGGGKAVLVP